MSRKHEDRLVKLERKNYNKAKWNLIGFILIGIGIALIIL